jgi:UTP:GlnB (protein PII) uridylyltransferase
MKVPKRRWVKIQIIVVDQPNILANIATVLKNLKVEILRASIETKDQKGIFHFTIINPDGETLAHQKIDDIFTELNNIKEVISVKKL